MAEWSLQDAKTRLSAVVNAALDGVPQHVTRPSPTCWLSGLTGF